jgi:hypothetical protein
MVTVIDQSLMLKEWTNEHVSFSRPESPSCLALKVRYYGLLVWRRHVVFPSTTSVCFPFFCPPICLSVSLSVCLSAYLSFFRLSVCPSAYLSACLSAYLSVCLPANLPICLPVLLSVCPPVCLSASLSVCMFVRIRACMHAFCLPAKVTEVRVIGKLLMLCTQSVIGNWN